MILRINGKTEELEDHIRLSDVIALKQLDPNIIIVELNENIIEKKDFHNIVLKENDCLEILRFVGGG